MEHPAPRYCFSFFFLSFLQGIRFLSDKCVFDKFAPLKPPIRLAALAQGRLEWATGLPVYTVRSPFFVVFESFPIAKSVTSEGIAPVAR